MKQRFEALKANISLSRRRASPQGDVRQDWQSPALDNARNIFQLVSNLGTGALSVPGLQAAGLIGVQIVDIVKVRAISMSAGTLLMHIPPENKREQGRLRTGCHAHLAAHGAYPGCTPNTEHK